MKNWEVDDAVYRAVDGAVAQRGVVNQAVYRAVSRVVNQAVYRAVSRAVYWAVAEAVSRAVYVAPPHPGLGVYLAGVGC